MNGNRRTMRGGRNAHSMNMGGRAVRLGAWWDTPHDDEV
jgi:hypothetical protein